MFSIFEIFLLWERRDTCAMKLSSRIDFPHASQNAWEQAIFQLVQTNDVIMLCNWGRQLTRTNSQSSLTKNARRCILFRGEASLAIS